MRTINQLTFIIGIGIGCSLVVANKSVAADVYAFNGITRDRMYTPESSSQKLSHAQIKIQNQKDLIVLEEKLRKNPRDVKSLYQEAQIYADMEQYDRALRSLNRALEIDPHYAPAQQFKAVIQHKKPNNAYGIYKNKLSFDWNEAYVSDVEHYWSYTSLAYYRFTEVGSVGARLNYAHRLGYSERQYQIEAYPKLNDDVNLAVVYAYANTHQVLFPTNHYLVEGYFRLSPEVDWSIGQRFINFQGNNIYTYTGSIGGNIIGNNYLWFRPYFYNTNNVKFYELGLKHTFNDNQNDYLSLKIGSGKVPDIGDLEPFDAIIIFTTTSYNLDGQYQLSDDFLLRAGIGYAKQVFPSGSIRRVREGSLGVSWLF